MPPEAPRRPEALAAACLLFAACQSGPPRFDDAFPDPAVLLTTTEPEAVRMQLLAVEAPRTAAHHERLLDLLRGQQRIAAANLVLLARAVHMPATSVSHTDAGLWQWARPGEGDAAFLDELLAEGLDRIGTIDRRWFGELIGLQQDPATLQRYCERFLAQLDDGSALALQQMLGGMPGSPMVTPFVLTVVARRGQLDAERLWVALDAVAFDGPRLELLRGLVARDLPIDDALLVRILQSMSFDSGRAEAFALMAPRVFALSPEHARQAVSTFSFDSGRQAACEALGQHEGLQLSEAHLAALASLCSFDTGRIQCLRALQRRLAGGVQVAEAKRLLATFPFDSERMMVVQMLAPRWRLLPKAERAELVTAFSLDSNQRAAAALLD